MRSKESVCVRHVAHVTDMIARCRGGRGKWLGRRKVGGIEEEGGEVERRWVGSKRKMDEVEVSRRKVGGRRGE